MTRCLLTPETTARIAARVEVGVSFADAVQAAGLKLPTAKTWLARGRRESEGKYHEFAVAIEQARERAAERPDPMTEEEFCTHVESAIRGGSVQAMKLWSAIYARGGAEEADNELGF